MASELGELLRIRRKELRLSTRALGERMGVSRGTVSNAELGIVVPQSDTLSRFSKALNLPLNQLVELAQRDLEAVNASRTEGPTLSVGAPVKAPPFYAMLSGYVGRDARILVKQIPFYDQPVSASQLIPREAEMPLPVAVPRDGNYLAVRVSGECMLPKIEPGDIVIVDADYVAKPGDVCLIEYENAWTLKRMIRREPDRWEFAPDNPKAGKRISVKGYGLSIIGVVIAVQSGKP